MVTLNGYSFPSTLGSIEGVVKIPVSAEHRDHAGIEAGDELAVEIVLDTAVREVTVPPDLAAALARDNKAKAAFDALSNSKKKQIVLPIEAAKTPETRRRRVEAALAALS